jgi:hypothetical protein
MKSSSGVIYLAILRKNPRIVYVGQSKRSLFARKIEHERKVKTRTSITPFHLALIKHGIKAWRWEVLQRNVPKRNLLMHERYFIQKLTQDGKKVGIATLNVSEAKKLENSPIPQGVIPGKVNPRQVMYEIGKLKPVMDLHTRKQYQSEIAAAKGAKTESRATVRQSCKTGNKTSSGGLFAYLDGLPGSGSKPRLLPGHKIGGATRIRCRPVRCIDNGRDFSSVKDAARSTKQSHSMIQAVCNGTYNSAGGLVFAYLKNGKPDFTPRHRKYAQRRVEENSRRIAAYSPDDIGCKKNKLALADTIKDLCAKLSVPQMHVKEVCEGRRHIAHGFRFAWVDRKSGRPLLKAKHSQPALIKLRPVGLLDKDNEVKRIFKGPSDAARRLSLSASQISSCCLGKLRGTGGKIRGQGYRFAFLDENGLPELFPKHYEQQRWKGKTVLLLPDSRTFPSLKAVREYSGIPMRQLNRMHDDSGYEYGGKKLVALK